MSEWNDAIEAVVQLITKQIVHGDTTIVRNVLSLIVDKVRELKKPDQPKQAGEGAAKLAAHVDAVYNPQPSVGRIVHVMIRRGAGLHLRPAIITRVGPVKVTDPEVAGRVGLNIFWAPEDFGDISYNPPGAIEADYAPEDREWLENHWRWPPRA